MIGIIPTHQEWNFSALPEHRRGYLEDDPPFEMMAIILANEASGEEPIIEPCRDGAFQTHGRPRHLPILGPFLGGRQFIALASIARRPLASGQRRTVTGQLAING